MHMTLLTTYTMEVSQMNITQEIFWDRDLAESVAEERREDPCKMGVIIVTSVRVVDYQNAN